MRQNRFDTALLLFVSMGLTLTIAIGGSMPVGALMGSKNATIDGQVPLPHTTLLSGDNLRVNDGLAAVSLEQGNRMILGRETEASFLREADAVTISLEQGNLSLYHPQTSSTFRVKAGEVTVAPAKGYSTLGDIAMIDGILMVTARDGVLQVEKAGTTQEVLKGKTIQITARNESAPQDNQGGNRHLKRIAPIFLYIGLAAGVGLVAWAIVASTSGGAPTPVSPVTPGP
ncbi:MAG: hypothetical protein EPN47_18750 [Acidobacteria bacterium]|nr:MAG: hypothetical protein EPN47_18750 [Acidobacteriota bacterium]